MVIAQISIGVSNLGKKLHHLHIGFLIVADAGLRKTV